MDNRESNYVADGGHAQPHSHSSYSNQHNRFIPQTSQPVNSPQYSYVHAPTNGYQSESRNVVPQYASNTQGARVYQPSHQPISHDQNKKWNPTSSNKLPSTKQSFNNPKVNGRSRRARSQSPQKNNNIKREAIPQLETSRLSTSLRYKSCCSDVPPCPTESFICEDNGNASPRHIRMTTHCIPAQSELCERTGLIIGAVVQPFANTVEGEETPKIISYSPVRCLTCNAYVNPHTKWLKRGKSFKCNFCYEMNDTPGFVTDYEGRDIPYQQMNIKETVESKYGLVDYIATKDYLKTDINDEPVKVRPSIIFALDVSNQSLHSGLLQSLVLAIRDILEELREDLDAWGTLQFGAITYDDTLYFHNYKTGAVFIVPDVDEPYSPLPSADLLFELQDDESYAGFLRFLEGLVELFLENRNFPEQKHCVGAAMKVGCDILSRTGGKLVLFQTGMPSVGIGAVKSRLDSELWGTKEELGLMRGSLAFYNELASKAADSSEITIGFDIFLCAQTHVDLASVAEVSRATGGQVYFYENYQDIVDSTRLYFDLKQNIMRFTAFDATMVIRASQGLEVMEQMGALTETAEKDIILPVITCDSTFCIKLNQHSDLDSEFSPCIQVAIIYTNIFGECMIRVLTTEVKAVRSISELFKQVDLWAVVRFSLCQLAYEMLTPQAKSIKEIRDELIEACVEILYSYRTNCRRGSRATELVLPESLRLLPMFTMSLLKHKLVQDRIDPDERVAHLLTSLTMPCDIAIPYVYPYMYPMHHLRTEDCTIRSETNQIQWPRTCPLSNESLKADGLYLLSTGLEIFLVWGEKLSETVKTQVFTDDDNGNRQLIEVPAEDPENVGWKVNRLISEIRWNRPFYQPLRIIERPVSTSSQATSIEQRILLSRLLQDAKRQRGHSKKKTQIDQQSYMDFLVFVHKKIQNKLG